MTNDETTIKKLVLGISLVMVISTFGFVPPLAGPAQAADIYVDAVLGNNTRTTAEAQNPATPWKTITYAAGGSSVGDAIRVAQGTYDTATGESFPISLTGRYLVSTTTLAATIDAGSSRAITLGANATIEGFDIKSTTTDKVIYVTGANANIISNRLVTSYSITATYDIDVADAGDNILIQGNTIDSRRSKNIFLETSADNPIIKDNTLTNTQAYQTGVHVNFYTTRVTIEGNTITADFGIQLGEDCSNIDIRNNKIKAYSTDLNAAAGMYLHGNGTVASNEVRGYRHGSWGGIHLYNGSVTIKNNTLVNNYVAIYNNYGSMTIKNNIVSAAPKLNSLYSGSYGISARDGYTTTCSYNDVFNCATNYQGSLLTTANEINTCPRFVNYDAGDYRIYNDSPCRGTADDGGNRGAYEAIGANSGITAEAYVSTDGNDTTGDGSFAAPWKTVTKAVSSTEGGTIYIMAGNYKTNETFPLILIGSQKLTRYLTDSASIDATGAGAKHTIQAGPNTTIESLTIKTDNTDSNYYAIYAYGSSLIKDNVITAAYRGIYLYGSYCTAEGNTLTLSNTSAWGIVVANTGDNSVIRNNRLTATANDARGIRLENYADGVTVSGNTLEVYTYGIEVGSYSNNYNINNNIIKGTGAGSSKGIYTSYVYTGSISSNEVSNYATGILADCQVGTCTVFNNTVVKNTTGIWSDNVATKVIKNNIISSAPTLGTLPISSSYGIYHNGGTTTISYNDVWNNAINYYNISAGTGDISQHPRFVNSGTNDYRLSSDSPCKTAGEGGTYMGRYPAVGTTSGVTPESYVSVSGSDDTGDGSFYSPWRTITKGLGSTEGTVYVRQGTYTAGETFPITLGINQQLLRYSTEIATIDSVAVNNHTVQFGSNTTLEGVTVVNASAGSHTLYINAPDVQIRNCTLKQSGSNGSSNAIRLTASGDRCSMEGNTVTATVNNYYAIQLESGADNPIIRNNTITGPMASGGGALFFGASAYPTVEGNTITGDYYGIYLSGSCTNLKIWNNKILATGTNKYYGIHFAGASTGIIATNEVRGFNVQADSAGINLGYSSPNLIIERNTIVKNKIGVNVPTGTANLINNIISAAPRGGTYFDNSVGINKSGSPTIYSSYDQLFNNEDNYAAGVLDKTQDLLTNPRFVNADADDYRLYSDSPCKGSGQNGVNRGAYEAIGSSSGITTESYVSESGSDDSGDGSFSSPWRTVTKGLGSTEGTVYSRQGTYKTSENFPITLSVGQKLINYLTEIATIDSTGIAGKNTVQMGSNTTLEGMTVINAVTSGTYHAVYVISPDVHIRNNKLYQNGTGGSVTDSNALRLTASGDRCSIEGNTATATADNYYAIHLESEADNPIIRNNTITGPHTGGAALNFASASAYPTVEGNTITGNYAGIKLGGACTNVKIWSNKILATGSSHFGGIFIAGAATGIIATNEVRGWNSGADSSGILFWYGGANLIIERNTIVKNKIGVKVPSGTANLTNNIISAAPRGGTYMDDSNGINNAGGTIYSSYNQVYNNEYNYSGTALNQTQDLLTDPRFVNADTNDYRLYADSPCKGSGQNGVNRGAYEAIGSSSGITTESYVSESGSDDSGDGTFANPWRTVTKGLGSTEGTVYARQGTYKTSENFPITLSVGQKLIRYGTDIATIDSTGIAGKNTVQMGSNTTLEGMGVINAVTSGTYHAVYVISPDVHIRNNKLYQNGSVTDSNAIRLNASGDRCSMEGNTATATADNYYAIHLESGADNPIIRNNTITGPHISGAALYFAASAYPTVEGNTITGNYAGINLGGACTNVKIWSNKILATGSSHFGGIFIGGAATGIIATNEVRGWNSGADSAGILFWYGGANLTINKNTITKCRVGVTVNTGTVTVMNNIFASEVGGYSGSNTKGIDNNGGTVTSTYNCLYANDITYEGTVGSQAGDIQQDPLFLDATNNNFHLTSGSPCDGTGTPTGTDMGAYDYVSTAPTVTLSVPNGGETWGAGTWNNITWSTTNTPTSLNLYYITSEASGWQTIATGVSDTGTYPWLVPNRATSTAKVSIEAVKAAEIGTDESNAVFTITAATDFYVDAVNGNNTYNGLTSEVSGTNGPWKTITYASTMSASSSTIRVATGTYNAALGESFPVLLTGKKLLSTTTRMATIEENTDATSILNLGDNTTLEGFCLKGNGTDKMINVSGSSVIIKGNQIDVSGYGNGGIAIPGSSNITIEANILHSAGNVAIYSAAASNVRIYKNEVRNCSGTGVFLYGNGMVVDRNTIVKNSANVYVHPFASNVTIKNNIISNQPVLDDDQVASSYGIGDSGVIASLSYNNVWKNDSDYSGTSAGAADISRFPGFVSPEADDYRLQASNAYWTNPCIAAGEGGVNIGAYDSVDAGVPYRTSSYVGGSGSDTTGSGTSESAAWRTLTRANKYAVSKISVGSGLYNAANGESAFPRKFGIDRYVKGADRNAVTIEAGAAEDAIYLGRYSSLESVTVRGTSGTQAILVNGTGAIVKDNIINASGYSYGIYADQTHATVEANIIHSSSICGIYSNLGHYLRVYQNEIRDSGSGGIFTSGSNVLIERNTIVKCFSYGIYSVSPLNVIRNNITINMPDGSAPDFGSYGMYQGGGTLNTTYDNSWNNYGNWEPVTISGVGTISASAKFADITNNDYHLVYNSPCIDRGDPASALDPDGSRADMGAYYFNLSVPGTMAVYVKEPNGGNTLNGLGTYTITWYATKEGAALDHIELYYSTDGGATFPYTIIGNTANTGSYLWPVPNTPTTQGRIRVIAVGSLATDESDSNFTILSGDSQGPTVEVTSPIGGELWKGGDTHNITFTATDEGGLKANSLYAWYSTNGGSTYPNLITREAIITSPFVWNIPTSINSQTVRVRLNIWDAYDNIGTAESPAGFTIDSTPPSVTVNSPSGGEKWQGGIDHSLNWSATDNFTLEANPITLQYSINSGADYTTIVTGEVNGGFFSWPTPSLNTNEARVKILAQDVCGNVGSGEGGNFVIDIDPPTAPVLLTPSNGSTTSDATTTFTWNASTDNLSGIASYEVIIDTDVVTIDATTNYTTPDALAEGLHTWRVKAKDGAGWWGDYSATWGFILDITTPEVLSITLKDRLNGSTQYSRYLTVSVEANGVTGVPVSMRLAQDLAFTENATAWLAYSAQTEYMLTAGEGSRTVYYKVRDAASNESTPVNQSITVDTVSPTVESFLMRDITTGSTTESNSLTITVEAYGVLGSPTQMRIAQDSSFTTNSTGWVTYVPTTEYAFTAGEGSRTAYYQVRDIASNESNTVSRSITIDTSGPSAAGVVIKDRVTGSIQYTNSTTVSVEVHDATGSPAQIRIYQIGGYNTGWFTYATTSEFASFNGGDGSKTLYIVMRDSAENESPIYTPSIFLDTVAPIPGTLLTPANNSYTNDTTPTFTWNAATDPAPSSGVASYEVVIDTTQIATLGAVTTFTTPDAETQGWHNWNARAKDNAQNWGAYSTTWYLTIETTNPTVTLGKPRGGQTLEATGSYNITWEAADDYGLKTNPVTLYFSSNAGSSWSTIQAGIAYITGEGTYAWTVPDVNSSQCRVSVEVEDLAGNKASNMSPANFTISNVQPTATVLYPNGGEYLKGNTAYNITWAATGEVEPVTINLRYSTNSGTSWTLIASNESNDGTYGWTTPLIDSTTCRVSIEATDGLSRVATDKSNADFAIDSSNPGVTVVAPAGGERIAGGSSYNVQWTATDPVGFPVNAITLRYSTDSGGTWTPIATAQPNTPPYSWTVPSVNSTTCRVSVEATDYVGNTTGGMSASDFIIDSTTPAITTITPTNGATSVPINTQVVIVFSKEMSREVTQNAFSLTASPAVAGGFGWSSDGKTLTFTPAVVLEYNTLYTVGVAATATDMAGNHLTVFSSTFTTAQRGDTEAPHIIIQRVDSQGIANTLKDGDYIPKQPRFKGIITDNLGVSRATIKFYLDDLEVSAVITEVSATRFEISYTVTSNLEGETVRTHSVKLTAADIAANSTTKEVKELKVSYESAKVMGPVLTYPTTYNPLTGQPARIAYNLTADQDLMIYMFDISGQNVWTGKYLSGTEGGKAGYNEVPFYGRSEISGSYLGNGIYVYKLVAGGKIIGTGRMAIF